MKEHHSAKEHNTEGRREQIVKAATDIIATQGLTALSIRTVATRAECSRGLVEHYFRGKTALLVAAKDWANNAYLDRVSHVVGTLSGLSALEVRLRNLLPYDAVMLDEWKVRVAFWHQGTTTPIVEDRNNQSFFTIYSAILGDIRHAQTTNEIAKNIPLDATSEMLLFMIMGLSTCCINDANLRKADSLDRRVKMIIGLLKTGDLTALGVEEELIAS